MFTVFVNLKAMITVYILKIKSLACISKEYIVHLSELPYIEKKNKTYTGKDFFTEYIMDS